MNKINEKGREWMEENRGIQDPRVLWDLLKYKIRHETIIYSKKRAKERRSVLVNLEEDLRSSLREDQAGVIHVISPIWIKLCQIEVTTKQL